MLKQLNKKRKILLGILKGLTFLSFLVFAFFAWLTIERLMMEYNEEGVHFDPATSTSYHSQGILGYSTLSVIFLLLSLVLFLINKKISR